MKKLSLVARPGDEGERLDRFIAARGAISRGLARRAIEQGGVFLDGRRCKVASKQIRAGYEVTVNLEEGGRAPDAVVALDRARILFADEHLVAVESQPACRRRRRSPPTGARSRSSSRRRGSGPGRARPPRPAPGRPPRG